jgi:autotransporter-associated beta strand protein
VENVSGTAGTEWDLVTVGGGTGTVTFNNTLGSPLTIFISGAGTGFSNSGGYSWTIIDAGTLSGFSADAFAFNYSTINGVSPTGAFSVSDSSGDLILSYTAATTVFDITVVTGSETQSEADGGAALLDGALATVNKLGAGTLVMTNTANSYTGVTTVKEGTLEIATSVGSGSDSVLGNASSAVVVGDVAEASAAGFNFGAAVQNDRGLSLVAGTSAADRVIGTTIGAGTATQAGSVVMATNTTYSATSGGSLLVSGAVSGAGNATISGAGTVVLSGNNSYSGSTTVSANSTLVASNNNAMGGTASGTTVSSGGSLALAGSIDTPEDITISGTGIGGAGALRNVNGDNAVSGTLTLSANALVTADAGTSLQLGNVDLGTATRQLTLKLNIVPSQ